MAVRLGGGKAFVPEVDGKGEGGAQGVGEEAGFGGLRAEVAGKVERIAEDDGRAGVFAQQAAEGPEVLFRVFANQSEYGLRSEAEFIGDGDADAAEAEIEAQEAGWHRNIVARTRTEGGILEWVRESNEHDQR